MRRIDQHEMRRGPANFGTGHHETEVRRLDMFSADFEAMVHGRREAGLVAAQTCLDAAGHLFVHQIQLHALSSRGRTIPISEWNQTARPRALFQV
jgi:hypothetical protein